MRRSDTSCWPRGKAVTRCPHAHSSWQRRRSASSPAAVWVAFLGSLREQPHDDGQHALRHHVGDARGELGLPRKVRVDPFHRVGGCERQAPAQHLEEDHAHGIEVGARVHGAVQATGLLGSHVGQGSRRGLRRGRGSRLPGHPRCDAESRQVDRPALLVPEHVARVQALVDHASAMAFLHGVGHGGRHAEEAAHAQGVSKASLQGLASRILQHQEEPPVVAPHLQRTGGPGGVQVIPQPELVLHASHRGRRSSLPLGDQDQDPGVVSLPAGATQQEIAIVSQRGPKPKSQEPLHARALSLVGFVGHPRISRKGHPRVVLAARSLLATAPPAGPVHSSWCPPWRPASWGGVGGWRTTGRGPRIPPQTHRECSTRGHRGRAPPISLSEARLGTEEEDLAQVCWRGGEGVAAAPARAGVRGDLTRRGTPPAARDRAEPGRQ